METAALPQQTPDARVLDALLHEKGLRRGDYALFFVVGEGSFFQSPDGADQIEEASGYVLDRGGVVHSFWLEWDTGQRRPILSDWERREPEPTWQEEPEYRDARRSVGLPL